MFDRFRRPPPEVVDLTGDPGFTLALMDRPWSWRQRQVEEMELGSASSAAGSSRRVTVTSGYQVRLPDGMEARLGSCGRACSCRSRAGPRAPTSTWTCTAPAARR